MTPRIDPKEVLLYLRELGYKDVSPEQLKDFMRDLKKLIKYEEKQKNLNEQENKPEDIIFETFHRSTRDVNRNFAQKKESIIGDLHQELPQKKESIIAVHIRKPTRRISDSSSCIHSQLTSESSGLLTEGSSAADYNKSKESNCTKIRPKSSASTKNKDTKADLELRPKSSFIRPRIPVKTSKSDPVALYQKYQEEWKKAKIPGENNRSALRWAIRERLMGCS